MTSSFNSITGWITWLDKYNASNTYDAHPDKVAEICSVTTALTNFESLCKFKNLVLLTRASMGNKVQSTFLHYAVGLSILPDDLQYVARIGMKVDTGVEVESDSLFWWMAATHIPDIVDLTNADTEEKFESVSANKNKAKKKICSFALLAPALAQVIHNSEISPAVVFNTVLNYIKVGAIVYTTIATTVEEDTSTNTSTSSSTKRTQTTNASASSMGPTTNPTVTDTEDEILANMGKPYTQVLLFYGHSII